MHLIICSFLLASFYSIAAQSDMLVLSGSPEDSIEGTECEIVLHYDLAENNTIIIPLEISYHKFNTHPILSIAAGDDGHGVAVSDIKVSTSPLEIMATFRRKTSPSCSINPWTLNLSCSAGEREVGFIKANAKQAWVMHQLKGYSIAEFCKFKYVEGFSEIMGRQ